MKNPSTAAKPAARLGDLAGSVGRAAVFPSHDDQFWAAPRSITNVKRNVPVSQQLLRTDLSRHARAFPQAQDSWSRTSLAGFGLSWSSRTNTSNATAERRSHALINENRRDPPCSRHTSRASSLCAIHLSGHTQRNLYFLLSVFGADSESDAVQLPMRVQWIVENHNRKSLYRAELLDDHRHIVG
jgi:hypothetical protein